MPSHDVSDRLLFPCPWPPRTTRRSTLALVALAVGLTVQGTSAQLTYSRGQSVSPAYEGWEQNADGSFNFLFGYMNRNWEEELDVPVGPENNIEPGGPDQGQPTHFLPRRNMFVFRVRVPKDWGAKELVWTLTTNGKTERVYATLRADFLVDSLIIHSETGSIGAGTRNTPEIERNTPPVLRVDGDTRRQIGVGQPLPLVVRASDDGLPKPRLRTFRGRPPEDPAVGRDPASGPPRQIAPDTPRPQSGPNAPPRQIGPDSATGLRVSWFVYRGAGKVTFKPAQIKVWEDTRTGANSPWAPFWVTPPPPPDGKWVTDVTFAEPGTYVLRCRASDGAFWADADVTITVTR